MKKRIILDKKKENYIMDLIKSFWVLSLTNVIGAIPWTFFFLFVRFAGVRLYHVRNREFCRRIQKKIRTRCSHTIDTDNGGGYAVGKWYVLSLSYHRDYDENPYDVWVIATENTYKELTKGEDVVFSANNLIQDLSPSEEESSNVMIHDRVGNFSSCFFKPRTIDLSRLQPLPHQTVILDKILEYHTLNNHAVVYLYGPTGTGKSVMGLLIAKQLKAHYCNTLKPWQPGDSLGEFHCDVEPSADKPLVVVFDEFDDALVHIHNGITPHKNIPISTPDKAGWNRMLDEIQWGMYPHLILVLTSNRKPEFITNLDPSYIREGRVDLIFHMDVPCIRKKKD